MLIDILSRFTIDWHWGNVGCKFVRYFQVSARSVRRDTVRVDFYSASDVRRPFRTSGPHPIPNSVRSIAQVGTCTGPT